MKALIITICFTFFIGTSQWLTDIEVAQKQAKEENKMIFILFSGSDWCIKSMTLKKDFFEKEVFTDYASKHLVLVNADFPRLNKNQIDNEQKRKNGELAERYHFNGQCPFMVLVDAEGKVLRKWQDKPNGSVEDFVKSISYYK